MEENQAKQNNLVETTDCLEAIGVFRCWKNFLFVIVMLCLLFLQTSFWLVNTGYIKADDDTKGDTPVVAAEDTKQIDKAAEQAVKDPNQPTETTLEATPQQPQQQRTCPLSEIKFKQLTWFIQFFNFVLIPAAALYCLTMLFSLKISLLGRLGGINHICRAFFLSLFMLVLLLPWQQVFAGGVVVGVIYTPAELLNWYTTEIEGGILGIIFYYLRFTGYWLLALLLLIFAQLRSIRWTKAILRRLEIV